MTHTKDEASSSKAAQKQGEPCDMKELCIGCSPKLANGKCPSTKPNGSCDCYVTGFNDGMKEMDGMTPYREQGEVRHKMDEAIEAAFIEENT
jgi:hypothetical protein